MVTAMAALVAEFRVAAAAHTMTVHGPVSPVAVPLTVVDLARDRAAGGTIARPISDAVLEQFGVPLALDDLGAFSADGSDWLDALAHCAVGVTGVDLAIAETATLIIGTHRERPRGTHIVPTRHIAVLPVGAIVADLRAALAAVQRSGMPSNLSWVSGPSRTADLEMRPTIGVHGPISVDVILVDSSTRR